MRINSHLHLGLVKPSVSFLVIANTLMLMKFIYVHEPWSVYEIKIAGKDFNMF